MTTLETVNKRIAEMTPKTGFNVVGVDRFESVAEALYFVSHHDTRAAAEAVVKAMSQANVEDSFHVYTGEIETA